MQFWWPLFLALKTRLFFGPKGTFSFLNVPREEGGGGLVLEISQKKIFSASLWIPGKCNHVSRCDVRIFQNIPQPTQRHSQGSKGKIVRKASVRTERRGNGQVHSIHYRYIDGREISGNNKSWQKDIRFCLPSVRSGWQGTKKPDLNGVTGTTSSYDPSTSSDDSDDFLFKFRPISRQGNNQHQAWLLIFARSEEAGCLQHTTRWLQLSHKYDLLVLIQKYTKSSHHSKKLLSTSGDLGIGLVWDKPTGPDRTEPLFSPTVEILFKLNLIIYDGSSAGF